MPSLYETSRRTSDAIEMAYRYMRYGLPVYAAASVRVLVLLNAYLGALLVLSTTATVLLLVLSTSLSTDRLLRHEATAARGSSTSLSPDTDTLLRHEATPDLLATVRLLVYAAATL